MAALSTPAALHALFIFNPTLGEENTEARKLLYFYDQRPQTTASTSGASASSSSFNQFSSSASSAAPPIDLNYAKDHCGIAEGLIAFTRDFSPDSLAESVHCNAHRYAFYQPEVDYWMVLVVKNPTIVTKEKNGGITTVYLEEELEDSVLQAILRRCYSLFTLFNNGFDSIARQHGFDALRIQLQCYMNYFLPTIRFSQLVYFTDIHGFHFLPVDKITFLTIQYLINLLLSNFGAVCSNSSNVIIHNAALMYNGKLIYSGFHSEIMFLLYSLESGGEAMLRFLLEYLTIKENLNMDIEKYTRAMEEHKKNHPYTGPTWTTPAPPYLPGLYNIPESIFEREARIASNKKNFDKEQNKGNIEPDAIFPEEDSMDAASSAAAAAERERIRTASGADDEVLIEKEWLAGSGGGGGAGGSGVSSRSHSHSNASVASVGAAPFGYMTGPFRVAAGSTLTGGLGMNATIGPPLHASAYAPCVHSPRIYLDTFSNVSSMTGAAIYPTVEDPRANAMAGGPDAPPQPPFASIPLPTQASTSADTTTGTKRPLRLVVYQKYKITLFLIVESVDENIGTGAKAVPTNETSQVDGVQQAMNKLEVSAATDGSTATSSATPSASSSSTPPQPPLSFYSTLESFIESNLHKLGDMLLEQSARLHSTSSGTPIEEPYRFLYFNHMNLALKTSLSSTPSTSSTKHQNASAGSILTLETIKLIRELHRDFNTDSFKKKEIPSSCHAAPIQPLPPHLAHSVIREGANEVCVKTKHHGWVVGRRATQSHREFFLLLEDKVNSLAEVQEEVDNLARTYFYNIYIH